MKPHTAVFLIAMVVADIAVAAEKPMANLTVTQGAVTVRSGAASTLVKGRMDLKSGDQVLVGGNSIARVKYRYDCRPDETIRNGQYRVIRRELHCAALIPIGGALIAVLALTAGNVRGGAPPVSP